MEYKNQWTSETVMKKMSKKIKKSMARHTTVKLQSTKNKEN